MGPLRDILGHLVHLLVQGLVGRPSQEHGTTGRKCASEAPQEVLAVLAPEAHFIVLVFTTIMYLRYRSAGTPKWLGENTSASTRNGSNMALTCSCRYLRVHSSTERS